LRQPAADRLPAPQGCDRHATRWSLSHIERHDVDLARHRWVAARATTGACSASAMTNVQAFVSLGFLIARRLARSLPGLALHRRLWLPPLPNLALVLAIACGIVLAVEVPFGLQLHRRLGELDLASSIEILWALAYCRMAVSRSACIWCSLTVASTRVRSCSAATLAASFWTWPPSKRVRSLGNPAPRWPASCWSAACFATSCFAAVSATIFATVTAGASGAVHCRARPGPRGIHQVVRRQPFARDEQLGPFFRVDAVDRRCSQVAHLRDALVLDRAFHQGDAAVRVDLGIPRLSDVRVSKATRSTAARRARL